MARENTILPFHNFRQLVISNFLAIQEYQRPQGRNAIEALQAEEETASTSEVHKVSSKARAPLSR